MLTEHASDNQAHHVSRPSKVRFTWVPSAAREWLLGADNARRCPGFEVVRDISALPLGHRSR
jgi:hypothetical protein